MPDEQWDVMQRRGGVTLITEGKGSGGGRESGSRKCESESERAEEERKRIVLTWQAGWLDEGINACMHACMNEWVAAWVYLCACVSGR